jgi:hypothetical protein
MSYGFFCWLTFRNGPPDDVEHKKLFFQKKNVKGGLSIILWGLYVRLQRLYKKAYPSMFGG